MSELQGVCVTEESDERPAALETQEVQGGTSMSEEQAGLLGVSGTRVRSGSGEPAWLVLKVERLGVWVC